MRDQANDRSGKNPSMATASVSRMIFSVAAAWVLSLGCDFFLHGGVLARHYVERNAFLLPPEEGFRRIPLGYLAFLVLAVGLYWLLRRLGVRGAIAGFRFGATAGTIVWGAFAAGLYSISTVALPLLVGWWFGQAFELGLVGAVLGAANGGASMKRIWTIVAIAVLGFLAATIVLQSSGFAPPHEKRTVSARLCSP